MIIWIYFISGFILAVIIPVFFDRSREERQRLSVMLMGVHFTLLGASGTIFSIYVALVHGGFAIGRRRGSSASFTFAEEPVAATLALLVTLAGTCIFIPIGWSLFKGARDRTLVL